MKFHKANQKVWKLLLPRVVCYNQYIVLWFTLQRSLLPQLVLTINVQNILFTWSYGRFLVLKEILWQRLPQIVGHHSLFINFPGNGYQRSTFVVATRECVLVYYVCLLPPLVDNYNCHEGFPQKEMDKIITSQNKSNKTSCPFSCFYSTNSFSF